MGNIQYWVEILLPVLSILIPVLATLYTVNNRIKAQNRENHQPYVVLEKVIDIEDINEFSYYLTPVGRNFANQYREESDLKKISKDNMINVKLALKNIGYGVATNIKFYNLLTGEQVHGTQASNHEQNQKLFTTLDMQAGDEKAVQSRLLNYVVYDNHDIIEDHIRMLCIYHDLHDNIYNFIISINAKGNNHYDFFAYQPSSRSYAKWIKENKKQFKKIIKLYNERV